MRRFPRSFGLVLALAVVGLLGPVARGAVIAYDYFEDYAAASFLTGQDGGAGWGGAWSAQATQVTVQSSGIPGYSKSARIYTSGDNTNIMVRGFPTQTGTVYVGFLLRTTAGTAGWNTDDFLQFYLNTSTGGSEGTGLSGGVGVSTAYFARIDGSGSTNNSSVVHSDAQTYQVVLKLSKGGANYDRTDIYVDRADDTTADATQTTGSSGVSALSQFHVRTYHIEDTQSIYLDALRIGTTYGEVLATAPLPPPPPPPTYYAYDGFSYPTGNLSGQNGGTGWAAAWSAGGGAQVVAPTTPLQFAIAGGSLIDGGDRALQISGNASPVASRALGATWSQDDVYASLLFRWDGGTPQGADQNDFVVVRFGGSGGPQFGVKMNTGTTPDGFMVRMGETGANEDYAGGLVPVPGDTYFLVAHLGKGADPTDPNDYDFLDLWISPGYGDSGSPLAHVIDAMGSFTSFSLFDIRTANFETSGSIDRILVDELRIAPTWDEAMNYVYIPEPATLGLLGAGLVLLRRRRIGRQRRRSARKSPFPPGVMA
ncbi:MAG TPA: PEP-CTERM sorting domain-containing protein [Planctomycetota bacterium]|nr:PEP-CTERM sorting domain-containing protein [Planctomycetota bacterium]